LSELARILLPPLLQRGVPRLRTGRSILISQLDQRLPELFSRAQESCHLRSGVAGHGGRGASRPRRGNRCWRQGLRPLRLEGEQGRILLLKELGFVLLHGSELRECQVGSGRALHELIMDLRVGIGQGSSGIQHIL